MPDIVIGNVEKAHDRNLQFVCRNKFLHFYLSGGDLF
jgi:hypothetical protein